MPDIGQAGGRDCGQVERLPGDMLKRKRRGKDGERQSGFVGGRSNRFRGLRKKAVRELKMWESWRRRGCLRWAEKKADLGRGEGIDFDFAVRYSVGEVGKSYGAQGGGGIKEGAGWHKGGGGDHSKSR